MWERSFAVLIGRHTLNFMLLYVSICFPEVSLMNRKPRPSLDRIAYVAFTRLFRVGTYSVGSVSPTLAVTQQRNNNTRLACLLTIHIHSSTATLVSDLLIPVRNLGDRDTGTAPSDAA